MSDLISRSALIDCISMIDTSHPYDDKEDILEQVLSTIDYQPTVDAKPIVRGKWIHDINNMYGCSICMNRETMSPKKMKNFCPNCGAAMKGE